jgi:uncharacterized protein
VSIVINPAKQPAAGQALLGIGQVLHTRLAPLRNHFRYGVYFLMLPMRSGFAQNAAFKHNRFGLLSFYDRDHGGTDGCTGLAWLDRLLQDNGIDDALGEAWLQTFPRVLGYSFKPVSFWFCHRTDGALRCVVVEVNNTFGERHVYLLDNGAPLAWGAELVARKVFHVSPFCAVSGQYRFRFLRAQQGGQDRLVIRIDHDDVNAAPLIQTSVSGTLQSATASAAVRAFLRFPLMTFAVIARIHWQALRLAIKRVRFYVKPQPPAEFVTRNQVLSSSVLVDKIINDRTVTK